MRKNYAILGLMGFLGSCGGSSTESSSSTMTIPQETPLASGPVVAFMGDSITQYWDGGAPAYPTLPITTLVPGALDEGIAGQTTDQMQQRFASDVLSKNPGIVVILGGTNDLRLEESPSIDNIAAMASAAAAAGIHVVIGTVPPSELWLGSTFLTQAQTGPAIRQFNLQLRQLASAQGYALADYWSPMVDGDGSTNEDLFLSDRIHPNAGGYAVMWAVLRPVLVKVEAQ